MKVMVDTIGSCAQLVPTDTEKVAFYLTGSCGIAWPPEARQRLARSVQVPIDQAPGVELWVNHLVLVVDVESGAKTIADAVETARVRALHGLHTTIYISASNLAACRAQVAAHRLQGWVSYWVANWSLSQEEAAALLGGTIVAIQYASPTSNPNTRLPGSKLTLAQANCDLSVTLDSWGNPPAPPAPPKPKPHPRPKPHPKVLGATAGTVLATAIAAALHAAGVHLTPVEQGALAAIAAAISGTVTPTGESS